MQLSVQVAADYQLEVRLVSYSNPTHRRSNGDHCDSYQYRVCDNIFTFKLNVGNGWEQQVQTRTYWSDKITFEDTLSGGLANPLKFVNTIQPWNVSLVHYQAFMPSLH